MPDVDELARPATRSRAPARGTPGATGPAGSPDSRRAPRRPGASSRGGLVLDVAVGVVAPRVRRRRRAGGLVAVAGPVGRRRRRARARRPGTPRRARRPGRRRRRSGRRTRPARRRSSASATRPSASSGMTSARNARSPSSDEPLVVVVDDDQVADRPLRPAGRRLELLDQARLAALAALLVLEREVVQPARRGLVVVRVERRSAGPRPTSRRRRRTGPRPSGRRSPRARCPAASSRSPSAVGSAARPAASRAASANAA